VGINKQQQPGPEGSFLVFIDQGYVERFVHMIVLSRQTE
jgi:hypothetical protein